MNVGAELRALRRSAGLSQAELAERAGTSQATISSYEAGHKVPSLTTLQRLLASMGAGLGIVRDRGAAPRIAAEELERRDRVLQQVIGLAAALPYEPSAELAYPRLR